MKVVSKNNSSFVLFLIFLDAIQNDELRSILLNLNINMNQLTLDDYKEAHLHEIGADSSRSGDTITWE